MSTIDLYVLLLIGFLSGVLFGVGAWIGVRVGLWLDGKTDPESKEAGPWH